MIVSKMKFALANLDLLNFGTFLKELFVQGGQVFYLLTNLVKTVNSNIQAYLRQLRNTGGGEPCPTPVSGQ